MNGKDAAARRLRILKLILIYLIFVAINIFANRLVKALGLPLYVDNIGTLLGAVLGGYLPGIFIGYITNIINSTADITNLYYAGISVLIAIAATFLSKKGFFQKFWKALLTVPVLAFFGGAVGSVLTFFIFGPSEMGFFPQMGYDFALDLLDKAITVVIAFLIMKLLPKSMPAVLKFTDWRQKPMTEEEVEAAGKPSTRGVSLQRKMLSMIAIVVIFISLVTTIISFFLYRNFSEQQYASIGSSTANLAALSLDGDRVDDYLAGSEEDPEYREVRERLTAIRDSAEYAEYIYVYQIREDGCHVVFDLDTEGVPGSPLGTVIPFDESFEAYVPELLAGVPIDPIITDDTYGWLLTAYEPVYDSNGRCVCYACADINMEEVRQNGISFLAKILSLFVGFFLLILVLFLWFSEYHMSYPIAAMTFAAEEFAFGTQSDLNESVERLKAIDVSTGDEIENLYRALTKTISDTVTYLEDVEEKGRRIEEMQSGLIYIMADLVESRDKNTGDHIRKTAAYVKLILELLQEENLYPEQLTEGYIRDVCHSAPLHDVGKIKVSDVILNKPGKLTDEEFEIMKSHSVAGREIIQSAIKLTGESGYLSEALNLATYHHEKWDGSGYPEGLSGEAIPLSARIMAIADVFDALLSKRSYKKPFTFEEAMDIIRKGAGTHFDPVLARVFLEHEDRVREVVVANEKWQEEHGKS